MNIMNDIKSTESHLSLVIEFLLAALKFRRDIAKPYEPGGELANGLSVESWMLNYERSSSNQRRRLAKNLAEMAVCGREAFLAQNDHAIHAMETVLDLLTDAREMLTMKPPAAEQAKAALDAAEAETPADETPKLRVVDAAG